jgi:nicotinamide-nucleotide adenylyltransferase
MHEDNSDYDAKLLLLSIRNADKYLKSTDASYIQRLEMMFLLTKDINGHSGDHRTTSTCSSTGDSCETPGEEANVAVAIIDEPTFVGKSNIMLPFLQRRLTSLASSPTSPTSLEIPIPGPKDETTSAQPLIQQPQLTFLLGFDTLERLFTPRYYVSSSSPSSDPTWQMLSSLRKFFSPSPQGDDSRVVCARRSSSPLSQNQDQNQDQPKNASETLNTKTSTLSLAEEFIASQRTVIIDIGEDEKTFSSTAVREMIRDGDSGWRRFVPANIAEYVDSEGLYR